MLRLLYITLALIIFQQCHTPMNSQDKKSNRLINESSPYLLQHAYNPVDWFPWGPEALEKAQKEDKLLIISIGYAACHWCHVMEHESFEDSLVASVMNEHFISIKVDREERPDVDDVYMTAAQLLTGRGGWPLNAIALPDGKPVFAGTYYPKEQWLDILRQIVKIKNENPSRLRESADKITEGISSSTVIEVNDSELDLEFEDIKGKLPSFLSSYDRVNGGRRGAPKFPMPNSYEFLMKYHWLTGDTAALNVTTRSLDKMALGGIYDQLGGGFARYSVDEVWLVPHFEKMLYDNAQLVSLYAKAYKLTGRKLYKSVVEETLDFVDRELTSPSHGFYSSLDADSEGEEGKFYVWTEEEIDRALPSEDSRRAFKLYYGVSPQGNWEHKTILNVQMPEEQAANELKMPLETFREKISEARKILMAERSKRTRPGLDDKVLTSWNALMISGYVDAYTATGEDEYLEKAVSAANFIVDKQMSKDGRLNRNFKDGRSSINAFLDDYALSIQAFLDIYETSFDKTWIDRAEKLAEYCMAHFFNDELKMFDYTSKLDPPLIANKQEYEDNVIPSSNSSMARSLFLLGNLLYKESYVETSEQMLINMLPRMSSTAQLSFYSNWYQLLLDFLVPPYEVAIVGSEAVEKNRELQSRYHGNSIFLGTKNEENLELLKEKLQEGMTMIYVCQNKTCKLPVSQVDEALELIDHGLDQ